MGAVLIRFRQGIAKKAWIVQGINKDVETERTTFVLLLPFKKQDRVYYMTARDFVQAKWFPIGYAKWSDTERRFIMRNGEPK